MKKCLILALMTLLAMACKTDMIDRLEAGDFENGGYIRTVTPYPVSGTTFSVSKANMSGTKMEFVAEAITPNQGAMFSSYDLTIRFIPATGTATSEVALKTISASSFTKDATTGYPRATITVTGTEALTATQRTAATIAKGDYFQINGTMRLTNGKSFTVANTGANITGGAFYSSPFTYRLNVVD